MARDGSILNRILERKREEVNDLLGAVGPVEMKQRAQGGPPVRDFLNALRSCPQVPVIAEIKKASPSLGAIQPDLDVGFWARSYEKGGAAALSVLTDGPFFGGCPDDLRQARNAVELPVLRKDFIIDPIQVMEARGIGADAVLLIAAALEPSLLGELLALTLELGMTPLVEVHNEEELAGVLPLKPPLIGINNRNLTTLEVSLDTSVNLRPMIDKDTLVVGESGIKGPEDVARLLDAGLNAFLVGTLLMKSEDPSAAVQALTRVGDGNG